MKCVASSSGKKRETDSKLKKSWTVAPAKAFLNSCFRLMRPSETMIFVTVVPILAPITIGTAQRMGKEPLATSPTNMDVVHEEL